jgi:hypothetical protein
MVLKDVNVDLYITQDLTEIKLDEESTWEELDQPIKNTIKDKIQFREQFAQKTSITRLNYIFKVLRHIFKGKASISDPDGYKDKIR